MKRILVAMAMAALPFTAGPLGAAEVADVQVPDTVTVGGEELTLNGAGIRKKFWIKVYVGALYLPSRTGSADEAVDMDGPKRVAMHMLYDVEKKKLVDAWREGFEDNTPKSEFESMSDRMAQFYSFWSDTVEGDTILLDYVPGAGTTVSINGEVQGSIPGSDFNRAMLRIWLGDDPADDDLKEGMLGQD